MHYDDNLIEEVRERNDIVDVISSYVSLNKKGADYFGLCPFHNEKTPSFHVSPSRQMYYCFGCHAGGNVYTFLMEYDRLTFTEAISELARRAGIDLPEKEMSDSDRRENDARNLLKDMNRHAAAYFHYLLKTGRGARALKYLRDRGLSDELISRFGLGYADIYRDDLYRYLKSKGFRDEDLKDSSLVTIDPVRGNYDRFFNRVMFPIMDVNRRVIGFGGRVMGEGEPKYLNSRETILFDKGRSLYGLCYARQTREKALILCEGYMDVISLHQAGFDNAAAPLGTAFTPGQAMLMKRYTKEVILSFDSDSAGVNAALRALPILRDAGLQGRVLSLKPYKDPDELIRQEGPEAFRQKLREAVAGRMFELLVLEDRYDQSDPAARTQFLHEAAGKLAEIRDPVERSVYIDSAANRFMLNKDDLTGLVNRYGQDLERRQANEQYRRQPETKEVRKRRMDEQKNRPQQLFLSWLADRPGDYSILSSYVGPEDFTIPLYRSVALMLYDQLDHGGEVSPAKIISAFPDVSDQKKAAEVFNAGLALESSPENRDKAITEIVRKIRRTAIDESLARSTDILEAQKLMNDRSRLDKMTIHLEM